MEPLSVVDSAVKRETPATRKYTFCLPTRIHWRRNSFVCFPFLFYGASVCLSGLTHRQLVKVDPVEGEVLVVDGIECPPHHPGLYLVLLLGQQLEFHVRIAEERKLAAVVNALFIHTFLCHSCVYYSCAFNFYVGVRMTDT